MKKYFIWCVYLLLTSYIRAQNFSERVKSFIKVDTTMVVIKNVTLIDGTGNSIKATKPSL